MITNPFHEYKNDYAFDNVYGHTLELLKRNIDSSPPNDTTLHLDVGCGYGSIAEHIVEQLGRTYVGVDANRNGLSSLNSRGFETHEFHLTDVDHNVTFLQGIIGNRVVGSITLLDTLEHMPDSEAVLGALYTIARKHNSLVVISVPNIQHRDIGFKLALGRLNYTEAGLLDHTHVRMFDETFLSNTLRQSGFHIVDRNDIRMNHSDQFFPSDHPVLRDATTLRTFLKGVRSEVNDQDQVNQIVMACLPGEKINRAAFVVHRETERPFLSIVTRTQGTRIHCLVEYFTCLSAQTCRDFEVFVVGHRLSVKQQIAIEQILEDLPVWLREKTRLLRVDHGNRTHPLNVGFEAAHGRYIAILDDDDLPMGNWVEGFKQISTMHDGRLLRCVSVLQKVKTVEIGKKLAIRATGPFEKVFASTFDFVDHFTRNHSPNNTLAFPRGVFHDLNMRFDEGLTTTEDWDYILRVAAIVGVGSNPDITGIYQWSESANSRSDHTEHEWHVNKLRIQQKMDNRPLLLPSGSFSRIIKLVEERDLFGSMIRQPVDLTEELRNKLLHIYAILDSSSWKITAPLRLATFMLRGRRSPRFSSYLNYSIEQLDDVIRRLHASRSWRLTEGWRRLGRFLRKVASR